MFNISKTIGAMAFTRGSIAPVSQVVQPRFEAPETTNRSIFLPNSFWVTACTTSIPRVAALTIGKSSGQVASPVRTYCSKVYAISASSLRPSYSGWFGIWLMIAAAAPARSASKRSKSSDFSTSPSPLTSRNPISELRACRGRTSSIW